MCSIFSVVFCVAFLGQENHFDLVKKLVNLQADVNLKDVNGVTALMLAIKNQNFEMVSYLINHGDANVNLKAKLTQNRTYNALDIAAEGNDIKILLKIIENGANFDPFIAKTYGYEINKLWHVKEVRKLALIKATEFSEETMEIIFQFLFSNLRLWTKGSRI